MKTIILFCIALLPFAGLTAAPEPAVVLTPTITIAVNNHVTCHNTCNGSATINVYDGVAPFSYSWSSGDTSQTAAGLCAGTYTCFVTDLNNDTASATVTIHQPDLLEGSISVIHQPGCQGAANGAIEVSGSGGTAPYVFHWISGDTTTSLSGLSAGIYSCTVTDSYNCTAIVTIHLAEDASTGMYGKISLENSAIGSGFAYAIKHESTSVSNIVDTVAWTVVGGGATGSYYFPDLPAGDYLLKILLDTVEHPASVPTYYGNAFQWDSSLVFTHGCMQTDTADIEILTLDQAAGSGSVSGHIIEGPGFANLWLLPDGSSPNIPYVPGRPLKGMDVKLGKKAGGIAARTITDTSGYYVFTNIADGDYFVFLDIPNLPMDTMYEIHIGAGNGTLTGKDYIADSLRIFIEEEPVGIYASENSYENGFRMYPNPSSGILNLQFSLAEEHYVAMEISNAEGSQVKKVGMNSYKKGDHALRFSTKELNLVAGVYFVSLISDNKKYTQRIVVID